MVKYLIDNNVISSFFSGQFSAAGMDFIAEIFDQVPNISVITQIEALSWVGGDKAKEQAIREFTEDAIVFDILPAVVAQCVAIRRNKKIKTPDAIIAATAIMHNLTLITSDGDFKNIPDLQLLNPTVL